MLFNGLHAARVNSPRSPFNCSQSLIIFLIFIFFLTDFYIVKTNSIDLRLDWQLPFIVAKFFFFLFISFSLAKWLTTHHPIHHLERETLPHRILKTTSDLQ